ncbi:major facilitator superfamily domain-containing protein [Lasiosphaeria miniovina]|uniref:Major facilitator superfamily domain-containing protein n=1 Tax=Lasiosphaeria miniovina TaxID=1954250 RepID=A0AA40B5D2_9PEZI|nr:major facilitator superfamily domain-containing protein [Lasiosphaeria miniovina]KAK0727862.1 major facilitator superfamily domain-containing protein [Lasiosphaeria miniovina]
MLFKKRDQAAEAPGTSGSGSPAAPAGARDEGADMGAPKTTSTEVTYPQGLRLVLIMASVFMSLFLVSLDRLIVSTAIPEITDELHSVTDIGWYGSAFLLTTCAFQLLFGKIYTFFAIKTTLLASILLFELGSAVCGAAPTSAAFILGRAIAGVGSAGVTSGIVSRFPREPGLSQPGLFGAVFGVSSVLGPLLGGVFTTKVTWRWCFYINLPFGAAAFLFIAALMQEPDRDATRLSLRRRVLNLDLLGIATLLPGIVCLLLALQWGGSEYQWSNGRIMALLVLAGLLLVAFALVQVFKPGTATIPRRVFAQRSIIAGFWSTLTIGGQSTIFIYFLPIWFQAVKRVNAVDSGIRLLPLLLSMVVASICAGVLTARVGYYNPFLIAGAALMAVGAGMLYTLQVDADSARWIGYQVLSGFGFGCAFQGPNLAVQAVLPLEDVPIGTAIMNVGQLLGGAVFLSVGQNVLNAQLLDRLSRLPGFDSSLLGNSGATSIIAKLPEAIQHAVVFEYNESLRRAFLVAVVLAVLTLLGVVLMEWRSVKKDRKTTEASEEGKALAEVAGTGQDTGAVSGDKVARDSSTSADEKAGVPAVVTQRAIKGTDTTGDAKEA